MTAVTSELRGTVTMLEVLLFHAPPTRSEQSYSRTVAPILMEIYSRDGEVTSVNLSGRVTRKDGSLGTRQQVGFTWTRGGGQIPGWVKEIVISQATAAGLQVSRLDGQDA